MAHYEKALSRFPDHPSATVGLSEILLDIYCQKIPLEAVDRASLLPSCSPAAKDTVSKTTSQDPLHSNSNSNSIPNMNSDSTRDPRTQNHANGTAPPAQTKIITTSPEELNRIAARDRAYGLLSSLTKLGSGWDYSEAWFSLARAYEEGGQVDKSKEVLWWCVNLEETRPLRNWDVIGLGGGVL